MAEKDDEADKSHEPTRHKLEEARKKGDLARSADLHAAAAYGGFLLAALAAGEASIGRVSSALMVLLDQASPLSRAVFAGSAASALAGVATAVVLGLAAWFLIPGTAALVSVAAQRGLVVAPNKVRPRLSRIDPIQNAKQKFGPSGLFEFAKSFAKLALYSVLLGVFLTVRLSDMAGAVHAEPNLVGALMARMVVEFMAVVVMIALATM